MRTVTVEELAREAEALVRHVGESGPVIVVDEGRPAVVVLRLDDDDVEDYILARNDALRRELDAAYEECLKGAGRPAEDILAELAD